MTTRSASQSPCFPSSRLPKPSKQNTPVFIKHTHTHTSYICSFFNSSSALFKKSILSINNASSASMSSTVSFPAFGMYPGAATGTPFGAPFGAPFSAPSLTIGAGDIARGDIAIGSGDSERIGACTGACAVATG